LDENRSWAQVKLWSQQKTKPKSEKTHFHGPFHKLLQEAIVFNTLAHRMLML